MTESTDVDTDAVLNCELIGHCHLYDIAFYCQTDFFVTYVALLQLPISMSSVVSLSIPSWELCSLEMDGLKEESVHANTDTYKRRLGQYITHI